MGADDDQAVPGRTALRPDLFGRQRRVGVQPGQHLRERRPAPWANAFPCCCTCSSPSTTTSRSACSAALTTTNAPPDTWVQELGHPVRPTAADVGQRDAAHLGGLDPAATRLSDELLQIRPPVPERGILRELRRPGGDRQTFNCCPMDVAGGEPARLEIRRYQKDPVERAAQDALPDGVEGIDLGQDMPAKGRVAPADDFDRPPEFQREQVTGHRRGELDCGGLGQAAGVRQNETGVADVGQPGGVLGGVEHGDHRHVVDGLRARRVIVQDRDSSPGGQVQRADPLPRRGSRRTEARRPTRPRQKRLTGGCHDSATSVVVMPCPSVCSTTH